jgi:hypothetical protein
MNVQLIEQTFLHCCALVAHLGRNAHEQNQATCCRCAVRWPNSDRSDCNADRTSPGKQRCERGASTDGLQSLRPVLVAAELLRWLPCLRILPPSSLLASSLLSILILMMIAGAEHTAPLPLTECTHRHPLRGFDWMSALPPKADMCGATRDVRFGPEANITE